MVEKIVRLVLSKWFFGIYFALGLLYFVIFPIIVAETTYGKSFFVMLALMTGSDPYSFKDSIESYRFIWGLSWLIHISSWLLIPALIGILISNAAEEIKKEQRLQTAIGGLFTDAKVKPEKVPDYVDKLQHEIDKMVKEAREKGDIA